MEKIDLGKLYKSYYTARTVPELVELEPAHYLALSGKGDPSDSSFSTCIQALYATAYTLKFMHKAVGKDFTVPKLEGLWWFDENKFGHYGPAEAPQKVPRKEWEYTLLIRLPEFVTIAHVQDAVKTVMRKKGIEIAQDIFLKRLEEGKCIQILHLGPYTTEPASLQKIQDFARKHQLSRHGLHHEIYLSDFRNTPQEKLKTILREPVK